MSDQPDNQVNQTMTSAQFSNPQSPKQNRILLNKGNVVSGTTAKKSDFSQMTEQEAYFSDAIIARPVMMPDILDFKAKHNEYAYRWVNIKAGGGKRYADLKYLGFENATAQDVDMHNKNFVTTDGIIVHDLILMKIQKEIYYGMLKAGVEKAIRTTSRAGIRDVTRSTMQINPHLNPASGRGLDMFVPTQDVIDAKIDGTEIKI